MSLFRAWVGGSLGLLVAGTALRGKMRSDWGTGRGLEEWRREVTEEVGKSTEHTAQGAGDCCLWWEQEKQPSFFYFL